MARRPVFMTNEPIKAAIESRRVMRKGGAAPDGEKATGEGASGAKGLNAVAAALKETKGRSRKSNRSPVNLLWPERLHVDGNGRPHPNLENVMLALREDPGLRETFAFDEFSREVRLTGRLPAPPNARALPKESDRELRDTDCTQVLEYLQHHAMPRLGWDTVHRGITMRATERPTHPVRNYLDGLRWDGQPRLESWLTYYLGADHNAYTRSVGRMFLISAIARVRRPGCKVDYVPILEGPQGIRKSTACAILGGEWYTDNLPDITKGKEVSQHLRGVWFVEIGELSAIGKAEIELLKTFITRQKEKYRPPYGREDVIEPRQCVFIGTTNATTYLRDETGARRFWPIAVRSVDSESLFRDRDQLFAEADAAFQEGWSWHPEGDFEVEYCRPEQERRYEEDPWADAIKKYVDNRDKVKVTEVAVQCLLFETKHLGTRDQRRISGILNRLGFVSRRDMDARWYVREG
jgi:predicted P-loop ATPase